MQVLTLRNQFTQRCDQLELNANLVLGEFTREFLTRAVHESNWQEGLELDPGKTQQLANIAFDEMEDVAGPHLDMNKILRFHRHSVVRMKSEGLSAEEIGAYNLARAHHAITWVGQELAGRQAAALAQALRRFKGLMADLHTSKTPEDFSKIERGFALVENLESDDSPVTIPMTAPPVSQGHLASELLKLDAENLLYPMKSSYIHFFHRLVLMGIMPAEKCGKFRKIAVHVGNFDLYFPAPSAVPQIMREYCKQFPTILPTTVQYDPILKAAEASHRFVSIHPYEDGNGRVSRLIMNLVLWGHFPPVYLKADKKGRHRYGQAIRRADRGDIEPLAALIAISLIEIYDRLLRSLGIFPESDGTK